MKIVIPILGFGRAGGERVLSNVATQLINYGNEVTFVVPEGLAEKPYYATKAEVVVSKKSKSRNKFIRLVSCYFNLWRECLRQKPDFVIANFHMLAYLVALLPIANKKKLYYIQAYEVMFGSNKFRKLLAYITYFLPLRKIVNHRDILPQKINKYEAVIPAGLDLNIFYPRDTELSRKVYNIGFIGRQEKHKGSTELIDLLCSLSSRRSFQLNIAIYLSDENALKLQKYGVKYSFFSIASDIELAKFYRENDLVIATGLIEDGAFHYPCAEAMASGCLVISNYAPLTETESRMRINSFECTKLIEVIDTAFDMDISEMTSEIQNNISAVARYDWNTIGKRFNSLLQN